MLRSLPICLLFLTFTACGDQETLTLATAADNFVEGQLESGNFRYAADSNPIGVNVNGEDHRVALDAAGRIARTTIVRGSSDQTRGICITFSVPVQFALTYPFRADDMAACYADFMKINSLGNSMQLAERHPVELTITEWTEAGDLRGSFLGIDTDLSGTFHVQLARPGR